MSSILRSIARNRAKETMKRKGMVKIFKHGFFANNWRAYAYPTTIKGGTK